MSKREFGDGILLTLCSYVVKFFLYNCYFLLCNLLLLLYFITYGFEVSPESKYVLLVALLPLGPAITALYSSMGKLLLEKDIPATYFFEAYRLNVIQSMKAWLIIICFIMIFYIDILFFVETTYGIFVVPVLQVLIFLLLLSSFYVFPIISKFHLRTVDVFRLSLYYFFAFYKATLFLIALLLLGATVVYKFPAYTTPFIFSLSAYVVMFALSSVFVKTYKRLNISKMIENGGNEL
jgi:uncharacterized membrane protein YesL